MCRQIPHKTGISKNMRTVRSTLLISVFMATLALPAQSAMANSAVCERLERQLARLVSEQNSGAGSAELRKWQSALQKQQDNIGVMKRQMRRSTCGTDVNSARRAGGQCAAMGKRLQEMQNNVNSLQARVASLSRSSGGNSGIINGVRADLQRNQCGLQYKKRNFQVEEVRTTGRAAPVRDDSIFNQIFDASPRNAQNRAPALQTREEFEKAQAEERALIAERSNTFRTICVRICDGFYYPVSFSTIRSRLAQDEEICKAQNPESEVKLFFHKNPGQDPEMSLALDGTQYKDLPNASRYQTEFVAGCSRVNSDRLTVQAALQTQEELTKKAEIASVETKLASLNLAPVPLTREQAREQAELLSQDAVTDKTKTLGGMKDIRVILPFPPAEQKSFDAQLTGVNPRAQGRVPSL